MEAKKTKACKGYGKPPWRFKGSALYQFHLVKSEVARALIPKEFRLVEAFGYTLGGFFLAKYDDSPAGVFDELVVIAGIVWNPPTSCAWASKVLVNSTEACLHGQKDVGLPSHVAKFTKCLKRILNHGWALRSKCRFQALVDVQSIIPIFSNILARWNAGRVLCSHFRYLGLLQQQNLGQSSALKIKVQILCVEQWKKLPKREIV